MQSQQRKRANQGCEKVYLHYRHVFVVAYSYGRIGKIKKKINTIHASGQYVTLATEPCFHNLAKVTSYTGKQVSICNVTYRRVYSTIPIKSRGKAITKRRFSKFGSRDIIEIAFVRQKYTSLWKLTMNLDMYF